MAILKRIKASIGGAFKRIAERIYLAAYPERKNDHFIAESPITPEFHIYERFNKAERRAYTAEVVISREDYTRYYDDPRFIEIVKERAFERLAMDLIKEVDFRFDYTPEISAYILRARFEFYKEEPIL